MQYTEEDELIASHHKRLSADFDEAIASGKLPSLRDSGYVFTRTKLVLHTMCLVACSDSQPIPSPRNNVGVAIECE